MARKGMDLEQFNRFMGKCADIFKVRYVKPTIHPGARVITAVEIVTAEESVVFNTTNHPDEDFNLDTAVNDYIDTQKW